MCILLAWGDLIYSKLGYIANPLFSTVLQTGPQTQTYSFGLNTRCLANNCEIIKWLTSSSAQYARWLAILARSEISKAYSISISMHILSQHA